MSIVPGLLNRQIGLLNEPLEATVRQVSINQLDDFLAALLDFASSAGLDRWLTNHSNA
ncbi:MAG: DUF4351 domain-containing protein [Alkalinema sp. CAN_BIN05]|nr:DUF4351 domain-containing protein [Alkalinema sp. CAN_BIN05]